jgi:hypothetical protein
MRAGSLIRPLSWRCFMDRTRAAASPSRPVLSGDFQTEDGVGTTGMEHSIENGHPNSRFSLLAREASCSQARSKGGIVSAHRGFNLSSSSIIGLFLPAQSSSPRSAAKPDEMQVEASCQSRLRAQNSWTAPLGIIRGTARQPSSASGVTHNVKLPRRRRPASYSAQFFTLNFILRM